MATAADVPAAPRAFRRDRSTFLLYATLGAFGALQTVPGAITPALRAELGLGYLLAGLHVTSYAAGSVVAGLAGPALERRLGRRRLLLAGIFGIAMSTAALTAARFVAGTLSAAFVAGLCGALVILTVQSGLSDHHGEWRAVAFSESNVLASVGATSAPLAVGASAAVLGSWRWGVLAFVGTAIAVGLIARRTPIPAAPPGADEVGETARGRLGPAALAGVLLVFAGVVLEWSTGYWGATYLRDVVGLSRSAAVAGMACFFGAMLVGRALGGGLARTVDEARVVAGALTVAAAGVATHIGSTATVPALAGLVLLGLGASVLFPLALALAVSAEPLRATTVSGRCVAAGSFAVLLGPLTVGQLADAVGLRPALLVVPTALAVAAGALGWHLRARPAAIADPAPRG